MDDLEREMRNDEERFKVGADAAALGIGFLRINPDGTCKRIDPRLVLVQATDEEPLEDG